MASAQDRPLARFILLYAALYSAFGVASPFLPAYLAERGFAPEALGLVLGTGMGVRLLAGPAASRIADWLGAIPVVLALCAATAALAALGYLLVASLWALFCIKLIHQAALAPTTTMADALALGASGARSGRSKGFEYGWVRGAGSAAFILGSVVAGQAISRYELSVILWLSAALLLAAGVAALLVPQPERPPALTPDAADKSSVRALLRLPVFRRLILVAALVLGSHAMHDAFSVIRWRDAGITPTTISLLWSESVAAEVLVFFVIGPSLVRWLTPAGAMALASVLGALRWSVTALSVDVAVLALIQPLHGVTFALLHLACMRLLAVMAPPELAATAQSLYGTVGVGLAVALVTLISGQLYGNFGAQGFWVMAVLCIAALPLALSLRQVSVNTGTPRYSAAETH